MKRKTLLCCMLVLVFCLSAVLLVACNKGISDEILGIISQNVYDKHKNDVQTAENYTLPAVSVYLDADDKEYTVNLKWEISGTTEVKIGELDGKFYPVTVPAVRSEDINYKLKVTLVDENQKAYADKEGKEYSHTFDRVVPKSTGSEQESSALEKATVKNPVAGTAYKWVTFFNYEYRYFGGEKGGSRLTTVDSFAASPDVFVENATGGGYYLYFMKDNVKTYINMDPYIGNDSGDTHSDNAYISTGVVLTTETANLIPYKIHESGALYVDAKKTCSHGVELSCSNMFAIRDKYPNEIASTVAVSYFTDNNKNHVIMVNECPMFLVTEELKVEQEDLTTQQILDRAFALGANEAMDGKWTLEGTVTAWAYSASYKNGDGKMTVLDKEITLFRLAGSEAANIAVGDKIRVKGILENHTDGAVNEVRFKSGASCEIIEKGQGGGEEPDPVDPPDTTGAITAAAVKTAAEALNLENGAYSENSYKVLAYVVKVSTKSLGGNVVYDLDLADAAGATKVFALYHGNLIGEAPEVGDKVLVIGHITRYDATSGTILQIGGKGTAEVPYATVQIIEKGEGGQEPDPVEVPSNVDRVDAPVADTAYLIAIDQGKNNKQIYLLAQMSSYYVATSADRFQGVKYYVEAVEGGCKIYRLDGGNKKYLGVTTNGTHVNVSLDLDYVWKIDAEGIHATIGEGDAAKEYYLGTNGIFETVGMYTADQTDLFKAYFGTLKADKVNAVISVDEDENATVTVDKTSAAIGETVTVTVTPKNGYVIVAVKVNGKEIEAVSGVYSFVVTTDSVVSVDMRDGSEPEPTTKDIELTPDSMELTKSSYSGAAKSITIDGLALEYIEMGYFTNGLQWRTKNCLTTTLYNTASSGKIVTIKFVPNARQGDTKNTNHLKLFYGETAALGESQLITLTNAEVVINFGADKNYQYFKIEHNNQGAVYIDSIVITVDNGNTPTPSTNEAKIGEGENATEYATLAEAVAAAKDGDTIVLLKDVVVDAQIKVRKRIVLNLNGKTISNTTDIWNNESAAFSIIAVMRDGTTEAPAELTITGNGKIDAKENDCYAVAVYWGGKLVIEDGEYVGNKHSIYVHTGSAEIKGGKFDLKQLDADKIEAGGTGYEFTLNLLDANGKNGTATITVTGGTFVEYDPSNSTSEAPEANFVAEGYVVTSSTVEDKTIYTVAAAQA